MSAADRPVMLSGWHAAEAASISHLEAMHQHQLAQYARQVEAQAVQIARLHQDLDVARSEIDRLTVLLRAAGAQLHDGPELETP
jgi:ABC-type hemin transport system ATPase subunit